MCGGGADSCYTYPLFSPNPVQRAPLSAPARLRALAEKLVFGKPALQLGPLASTEALARFQADLAEAPRGVAYVVHLLLPHYGYLYNSDCSLADPSQWQRDEWGEDGRYAAAERAGLYRLYLAQTECATARMAGVLAQLRELGVYDEATIIIHGDHGSRLGEHPYVLDAPDVLTEKDLLDHYATLLAIKAPGVTPGLREQPAVLQRVFADAFLGGGGDPGRSVFVRIGEGDEFAARAFVWPSGERTAGARTAAARQIGTPPR
jgi:hypothetical protein